MPAIELKIAKPNPTSSPISVSETCSSALIGSMSSAQTIGVAGAALFTHQYSDGVGGKDKVRVESD